MELTDPSARGELKEAWAHGKLVIVARLAEGPQAGQEVLCVTSREEFVQNLAVVIETTRASSVMQSLRKAIHDQVVQGLLDLTPQTDQNFMGDLVLLMSVACAIGETAVEDTGLFSIMFAVNPDDSLPWHQRGILQEADVTAPMHSDRG